MRMRSAPSDFDSADGYRIREVLIKSAAVDGERFFVKTRFEKRGNTVCISRFSNRRIGGKDPSSAVGDLFRGSLEQAEYDKASDALFSLARAAFQAGWLAAGGREAQPERIFTVLRPEAGSEKP